MTVSWDYKHAYPGGPMVKVKGFPRPLYPPNSAHAPSDGGPDVVGYKSTISRLGRWPWQEFDDLYSSGFAYGRTGGNVGDSGVVGFQKQMKIDPTGNIGETTFNALRSAKIPEGLPHAGEYGMDATAVNLINEAYDLFKGEPDTRFRLSTNFTVEEFDCHDGTKVQSRDYEGLKTLCSVYLEPLRSKFGTVTINSGFRTPTYNASVGGASNSYHIYTYHNGNDQAADVTCVKGTPSDWHAFLNNIRQTKRSGNGGLGLYPTFVHVDMRDYPSSWKG